MKSKKYEKVWQYLSKNPTAKASDVAKACKCSVNYVYDLKAKAGTPKEVFEKEAKDKAYQRSKILSLADKLTSSDREVEHGDASKNFEMVADFWSTYLGVDVFPHEVPMMMVLYKIARTTENPTNIDNYVDTCGYGALAGEQVPNINRTRGK
ncbi:MAG: DUF6378 domain-containing protein [Candidatus Poseidoniales archaeon]|jgi:hypothetical protein